jgi:hypothetical protein
MMEHLWSGVLQKMRARHTNPIEYSLVDALDDLSNSTGQETAGLDLNPLIGKQIHLFHKNERYCVHCGNAVPKLFAQGCCYPCLTTLPQNDMCMLKPETCHFHDPYNPCRDAAWGERHCFADHILYMAVSASLKVGITRHTQVPTRWIDQGASFAVPLLKVPDRLSVGLVERALAEHYSDRTPWQRMLKNEILDIDLLKEREAALPLVQGFDQVQIVENPPVYTFNYPALAWPTKIKSVNFERVNEIEGRLIAIKGQYLILDSGVFNVRKHSGYFVHLEVLSCDDLFSS